MATKDEARTSGELPDGDSPDDRDVPGNIARRRAILKGLGKTAALAGAATPLSSLAGSNTRMRVLKTDAKYYNCSVSGNMSVLMSQGTANLTTCSGKAHSYYSANDSPKSCTTNARARWPTWPTDGVNAVCYLQSGTTALYCNPMTHFNTVFGAGSTTMFGALCNLSTPTSESQWVAALLNANVRAATFPDNPERVIALYKDTATRAAALSFYTTWLNTQVA